MQKSLIIVLISGLIVAVFAVLNAEPVTVNLIFARFRLSQAVVILVSAVMGALTMYLMNLFQVIKLKRQVKQLSKKLIDSDAKNVELVAENKELEIHATYQNTSETEPVVEQPETISQEPVNAIDDALSSSEKE